MLVSLPALNDNYIWVYRRENFPVIIVDISEVTALLPFLQENQLDVEAVLLTHKHDDHVAGVAEFKKYYPNVPIYGPAETLDKGVTEIIDQGIIFTKHYQIKVIPTGGHTEQHVSYLVDEHLFCGDVLFSAGCGRVFTGNYQQMFDSLQTLKSLSGNTILCPGHEYTLSNLKFTAKVWGNNHLIEKYIQQVEQYRLENKPTVPTTLEFEKKINAFLQTNSLEDFIALRQAKDNF